MAATRVRYAQIAANDYNSQTGTTYTLVLADRNKVVRISNAATITLTVPTNASVAYSVGDQIDLLAGGAGKITVSPAGGVTVISDGSLLSVKAYSGGSLYYLGSDTWQLVGNLV